MKRFMKIHFDEYRGGLYEFEFRKNELPGLAKCPVCGSCHAAMELEILTLEFNAAPVCFDCIIEKFPDLLSESDIEGIVETGYLEGIN